MAALSSMDRMLGFEPSGGGSIPSGPAKEINNEQNKMEKISTNGTDCRRKN